MAQQRLEDLFLEQLWEQWLMQIQRVIRCGLECDRAEAEGQSRRETRAASRAAWAMLDGLERIISKTAANDAFGIAMKLAIWRHWRDAEGRCDESDPSHTLVRSAYRVAVDMCGVDFTDLIREAEAEALDGTPRSGVRASRFGRSQCPTCSRSPEPKVIQLF